MLSQKPFATDLDEGRRLVEMAEDRGVKLAVNQNGRWSPHMAWMREAVRRRADRRRSFRACQHSLGPRLDGPGTPFDEVGDLVLFDFGVHWFDFVASLAGERVRSVFATAAKARGQANRMPLLAQARGADGGRAGEPGL